MSIASDCSADTAPQLIAMSDLSSGLADQPLALQTNNPIVKNSSDVILNRSGNDLVPHLNADIPQISTNTVNIAINSGEIRPAVTAMPMSTRTIAPKPVTAIPLRPDSISGPLSGQLSGQLSAQVAGDKTQTVMITTTTDSAVSSNAGANKYGINKVIPISNHIALVTSPDGMSMLAVPMSSLVTKGNVKPTISTVPISSATLKAKSSIITPVKILPLIASTTATTTLNVPTISKNMQTLLSPASLSIAKGISTCSTTSANTTNSVTIIPTVANTLPKPIAVITPNETQIESTTTSTIGINLDTKDKILPKDENKIEDKRPLTWFH